MSNFYFDKDCPEKVLEEGKVCRKIKAHDGNIMMVEVSFTKGAIGTAHTHPHEQCTYVITGVFEFSCGDEKQTVEPGDTIYFPPDILHGCVCLSETGILLDIFTPQREDFL